MTEPYELSVSSAIRSLDPERVKSLLLTRLDLARQLDPNLVFAGVGNPPTVRVDTSLPTLPDHVKPGDLIEADDWNLVLDVLARVGVVLANLADGEVALAGRTAVVERKLASVPLPPQKQPDPRDYLRRFLADDKVVAAIASNDDLTKRIFEAQEVVQVVKDDPGTIERSIEPVFDPGPDTFATPESAVTAKQLIVTEALKVDAFKSVLAKDEVAASQLGVSPAQFTELKSGIAAEAKAGVAKAGVAKAGVAKAGIAKAGVAPKAGGGG